MHFSRYVFYCDIYFTLWVQKADDEKNLRAKNGDAGLELGVGRVIPLKQVQYSEYNFSSYQ